MTLTATDQPVATAGSRRPAWLLLATLPAFVAYVAFAVLTIAKEVSTSADLTPAQLDDLGVEWMVLHLLWVAPPALAAVALAGLAARLRGAARHARLLAAVTGICLATYLVVNLLAYGSDTATWGDDALYPWSYTLSLAAGWLGVLPATILAGVTLARQGVARRTCWTVSALVAVYWVLEVLTYLPVLLGPATFAEFEGGLPPFLLGVLWAVLGGGLLRSGLRSDS